MSRSFTFVLLLVVCLVCIGPLAAQDDTARVRIGYFAFDPREYDTFIDGELAPFNAGWDAAGWLTFVTPGTDNTRVCCSATPYMSFPAGDHSIAFAPLGSGLGEAIADPQDVTLIPGHVYSLAVVGGLDDGSLSLVTIDETEAYAGAEPGAYFAEIIGHDVQGLDTMNLVDWSPEESSVLEDGQFATGWWPGNTGLDYSVNLVDGTSEETILLFSIPVPAGLSNLAAFIGTYPGSFGDSFIYAWNYEYPGEVAVVQGSALTLGEPVAGELTEVGERVAYSLTLDQEQAINLYAHAAGTLTAGWNLGYFDTYVYVYDAQGNLLFWNDDLTNQPGVAGLEGVVLPAGDYVVQVGSFADSMAGPFELLIEAAQ